MTDEITVRRAKPSDATRIAKFVNQSTKGQRSIDEMAVIERFGNVGLMVAELTGNLVGILGWRAENLVVRVTDFLIRPIPESLEVGRALLSEMEEAAAELQCEVVLLFLPRPYPPQLVSFCGELGYRPEVVAGLPSAWQEAAREARLGDDEAVLAKQLRSGRVLRPL